jgi:hypothetical protein
MRQNKNPEPRFESIKPEKALALAATIGFFWTLAGGLAPARALAASGGLLQVSVDKARVARIPDHTRILVIGQPGIADVTMLKNSGMGVITGKSFGETNLIALDAQGNLLGEWTVRVGGEKADLLVQNGLNRESYICAPLCLPVIDLADAKTTASDRAAAVAQHSAFSGVK